MTCKHGPTCWGGIFDYENRKDRLAEVELELGEPDVWNKPEQAQELGRERASLELVVKTIEDLDSGVSDARELLGMAVEENDEDTVADVEAEMAALETQLAKLEFRRMFSGAMDENSAFLEIQSGSGGTEAQDWAEMLLRMYLRWADDKGFKAELLECSAGDVAGIKSATVEVTGEYAFGWLRTEIGVHRLVRKSPFDSGNRRHTSFAAVFISPEIDDNIEISRKRALEDALYIAALKGGANVNGFSAISANTVMNDRPLLLLHIKLLTLKYLKKHKIKNIYLFEFLQL